MKVMIVGAGGVGGYLCAMLSRLNPDITLVARGRQLEAIQEKGLTLRLDEGQFTLRPSLCTDKPQDAGEQDAVFLCVKGYGLEEAVKQIIPAVGAHTLVVPLLNGVDTSKRISALLPQGKICDGCIYIYSRVLEPGVILRSGGLNHVVMGLPDNRQDPDLLRLAQLLTLAGVPTQVPQDIRRETWKKWCFICSNAQATSYYSYTVGQLREDPEAWAFLCGLLDEVLAVSKAEQVNLPADTREQVLESILSQPYDARSSLSRDLEIPGKPTELFQFAGVLSLLANQHGIPVPYHQKVLEKFKDRL